MSDPEEHQISRAEVMFDDFMTDNKNNLKDEFIEENYPDEFDAYCRERFKDWNPRDD
jgi:hypothetical protein